jgi:hypothetical protein
MSGHNNILLLEASNSRISAYELSRFVKSEYIVEEPDESPIHININGVEVEQYWREYSPLQKKKFKKVLNQLKEGWIDVYNFFDMMIKNGVTIEHTNTLMNKVHNIYFNQYKYKIDYYNEEKIRIRKNKNYMSKKINKLRQKINKV